MTPEDIDKVLNEEEQAALVKALRKEEGKVSDEEAQEFLVWASETINSSRALLASMDGVFYIYDLGTSYEFRFTETGKETYARWREQLDNK